MTQAIRQFPSRKELDMKIVAGLRSCLHVTQHTLGFCRFGQFRGFISVTVFQ
jgi:hypothetical protein